MGFENDGSFAEDDAHGPAHGKSLHEADEGSLIDRKTFEEKQKEQQKQLTEIKALKMDELTDLIGQLYGDAVRVKVLPDPEYPENVFIGSGELANFHDTAASLVQEYGYEIDADWVTLGQINLSRSSEEPASIPTGNQMDDSFEQIALAFNNIIRMASAAEFPTISFTPISIYRTVVEPSLRRRIRARTLACVLSTGVSNQCEKCPTGA